LLPVVDTCVQPRPADPRRCGPPPPNRDADPTAQTHSRRTGVAEAGASEHGLDLHRPGRRIQCRHHHGVPLRSRRCRPRRTIAPTLDQVLDVARRKAYVILDGTLLAIDRGRVGPGTTERSNPVDTAPQLERAGPRRPRRQADLGRTSPSERPPRRGRYPRTPDHRRPEHRRHLDGHRHLLPRRRSVDPGFAARSPAQPRHRPLPAAVASAEAVQLRARPPALPRGTNKRPSQELAVLRKIPSCSSRATALVQAVIVLTQTRLSSGWKALHLRALRPALTSRTCPADRSAPTAPPPPGTSTPDAGCRAARRRTTSPRPTGPGRRSSDRPRRHALPAPT